MSENETTTVDKDTHYINCLTLQKLKQEAPGVHDRLLGEAVRECRESKEEERYNLTLIEAEVEQCWRERGSLNAQVVDKLIAAAWHWYGLAEKAAGASCRFVDNTTTRQVETLTES